MTSYKFYIDYVGRCDDKTRCFICNNETSEDKIKDFGVNKNEACYSLKYILGEKELQIICNNKVLFNKLLAANINNKNCPIYNYCCNNCIDKLKKMNENKLKAIINAKNKNEVCLLLKIFLNKEKYEQIL